MKKISIKNLAKEDQPRFKVGHAGVKNLTNSELLAILINCGNKEYTAIDIANLLLNKVENSLNKLGNLNYDELMALNIPGFGNSKITAIIAALELGIRRNYEDILINKLNSTKQTISYLKEKYQYYDREVFVLLLLNNANKIIKEEIIGIGGISSVTVDVRLILKSCLIYKATSIIVSHNHPSGNTSPSKADMLITRKLKESCDIMDIRFLDHIIVGIEDYYSFGEHGII
ncbi:MAG: DNA repair protein RadC [Sediminibacterium sp.]|nr:DNA repair protein RadC [Sediminibacterium sp.]